MSRRIVLETEEQITHTYTHEAIQTDWHCVHCGWQGVWLILEPGLHPDFGRGHYCLSCNYVMSIDDKYIGLSDDLWLLDKLRSKIAEIDA